MPGWTEDELRRIGAAQESQTAPVRVNGELRRPTTIWGVRADDGIHVRAAYGSGGVSDRVARRSRQARLWAGGVENDVALEDDDPSVLDDIDGACHETYGRRYANIVDTINDAEHRATTLRLVARGDA